MLLQYLLAMADRSRIVCDLPGDAIGRLCLGAKSPPQSVGRCIRFPQTRTVAWRLRARIRKTGKEN
jgi:hypothetical protein